MKFKEYKNKKIIRSLFLAFGIITLIFTSSVALAVSRDTATGIGAGVGTALGGPGGGVAGGAIGRYSGEVADWLSGAPDWLCDNMLECGDKGKVTDFINFEGGLEVPSGKGLAPKLTEVKSATQFIINVTNFVLSFLGLLAVVMIIYGGILYVTARGEDDQTGKAKKTITYAVVGIFVILISFALVNTILKFAPIGQPDTGEAGGRGGTTLYTGDLGENPVFHVAALEIQANMQNFVTAYRMFALTRGAIERMETFPDPADREEALAYLEAVRNQLGLIVSQNSALSEVHVAAKKIISDFVDPSAAEFRRAGQRSFFFQKAFAQENSVETRALRLKADFTARLEEAGLKQKNDRAFSAFLTNLRSRLDELKKAMGPLSEARTAAESLPGAPEEIQRVLTGIPANFTLGQAFSDAFEAVRDSESLVANPDDISKVGNAMNALGILRIMIREVEFVFVRINASATEGNAPLAVQFDALGSLDPSGKTIQNDRYEWDLDGDGIFNEPGEDCGENTRQAGATCVYKSVGTYRASLKIAGSRPDIASGISFITVTVNPPRSRISLVAKSGENEEVLRGYDISGRLTTEKSSYRITKSEGKNGIIYDASKSADGAGVANGLTYFEWNFGDGTDSVAGPSTKKIDNPKKTYANEGTFSLSLEVTDKGGIKDRKITNVSVSSIAARILSSSFRGELGKTFEFDGSRSKSDVGQIKQYEWGISDESGREITGITNNTNDSFRYQFPSAGKFTVSLTVVDGAGNEDTASVIIIVESKKPKAIMEIRGCFDPKVFCLSKNDPALTELDGTKSFDPDPGDEITYAWEIPGATEGIHFSVVDGVASGMSWNESPKMRIRFLKKGDYRIILRVQDQHIDEDLRKTDSVEQKITVSSTLSASFSPDMEVAKTLLSGESGATFDILANIGNVSDPESLFFEVRYGDGKSETFPPYPTGVRFEYDENSKQARLRFSHTYEEAGSFPMKLKISATEGEMEIQKYFTVAGSDSPFAIIQTKKNGVEIFSDENDGIIEGNRNDVFTFNGNSSLASDGSRKKLKYSWDFGDGSKNDRPQTNHKYENVSPSEPGYFEVKLTVFENDDPSKKHTAVFRVKILGEKPTVQTLNVVRKGASSVTPMQVELTAEGAFDADGQIKEYSFWYFDQAEKERKLGLVHVPFNHTSLTVETYGLADQVKKYLFCVEVKDNENNISTCDELFSENSLPFIEVVNGPNQAPTADFSISKTSILAGESVSFSSNSTDKDGNIVSYVWDFEGDGFHNNTETNNPNPSHKYEEKSPGAGFAVQLKAIDDRGASGYSLPKYIFVDSPHRPPTASFQCLPAGALQIRCTDLSRVAPGSDATIVSASWDFNASKEFCNGGSACPSNICRENPLLCDSVPNNDPDRKGSTVEYAYDSGGNYTVVLNVKDSNGETAVTEKNISVERNIAAKNAPIDAVITTDPPIGPDGKLHLPGNGANISLRFNRSTGRIDRYILDKNIYFDSGIDRPELFRCGDPRGVPPPGRNSVIGDGCLDNDADEESLDGVNCIDRQTKQPKNGCQTYYQTSWLCNNVAWAPKDSFRAKLTVFGTTDNGAVQTDTAMLDITFDKNPVCDPNSASAGSVAGEAYLFQSFGAQEAIVSGLIVGALAAISVYFISLFGRSGKPRELS